MFKKLTTCKLLSLTSSNIKLLLCLFIIVLISSLNQVSAGGPNSNVNNEELYKLLGVSKTATTKQIRIAFKKIALEKHPDKNQDDPNANEEFIKINRAYEILKDDELRKKYDTYGEEGLKDDFNKGYQYQSWNFYKQNFGIYDDDPEVATLSRSDFMQTVLNSDTIWFINFYSTQCSHCHELAPTWRDLAKQLDGVVKIGAVNCMDDWMLCNEQQIQAFPTLIMYPKKQRFNDVKSIDNLIKFALSFASGNVYDIGNLEKYDKQFKKNNDKPWLISYCLKVNNEDTDTEEFNYELNCLDELVQRKLAIMLHGMVRVGSINCNKLEAKEKMCPKLKPKLSSPLVYYYGLPSLTDDSQSVNSIDIKVTDYKKIVQQLLTYLPDVKQIEESEFTTILEKLRNKDKSEKPWLIQFVFDYKPDQDLELRKLPNLLASKYNFGRIDCAKLGDQCIQRYQITKYPTFVVFKSASSILSGSVNMGEENWYEIHYGTRQAPEDLANFVKDNAHTPVRTLTLLDSGFIERQLLAHNKLSFFVDFFAPWCPPCMNLLPEFRKASILEGSKSTLFATIDCAINGRICELYGVRSYPTTILFNNSNPHNYHGQHSASDISDFIQDILKPSVITLNYESFHKLVGAKPVGKIWLVDFFASWCGPCQQLAPEWRKLAKRVDSNIISVGQVDCVTEQRLCMEQGVQSYPNIRIYPSNSKGFSQSDQFQGWMRDANSLLQWATNYLPSVTQVLDMSNFERLVLRNRKNSNDNEQEPWLIDFYAPWCGHCQVFSPTFESLANKFEGIVKFGKVNCQEHQYLCQMSGIRAYPTIRFYPLTTSDQINWNSGEEIQQLEFNAVFNALNTKLKVYNYRRTKSTKSKSSSDKTEL